MLIEEATEPSRLERLLERAFPEIPACSRCGRAEPFEHEAALQADGGAIITVYACECGHKSWHLKLPC